MTIDAALVFYRLSRKLKKRGRGTSSRGGNFRVITNKRRTNKTRNCDAQSEGLKTKNRGRAALQKRKGKPRRPPVIDLCARGEGDYGTRELLHIIKEATDEGERTDSAPF